jgi:hypothetical protein
MSAVARWGSTTVLLVGVDGAPIGRREARDLVADAIGAGASVLMIPVARLEPAFFDLRSGVAGDVLQVFATYRVRLAVVGAIPEPAASSRAFAALVRESNAGTQHWFQPSIEALRARLG